MVLNFYQFRNTSIKIKINWILALLLSSRINWIEMKSSLNKNFTKNLRIIQKASSHIAYLYISDENLKIIDELYKDKHINFMIDYLFLYYNSQTDISNRDIEVLNKINPKALLINKIGWTLESIKSLTLLDCTYKCWFC